MIFPPADYEITEPGISRLRRARGSKAESKGSEAEPLKPGDGLRHLDYSPPMNRSTPSIIDADFTVIREARTARPIITWTFWADDFPEICAALGGAFAGIAVWWFFHAIHWFG
jgi:hypothetical protein